MGTQHTSIPAPGGFGNQTAGAAELRGSSLVAMPQDGWIDTVWYYTGGNGATHNFTFGIYRTDTAALVASTTSNGFNGKNWKSLGFSLNSGNNNSGGYSSANLFLPSGFNFLAASYADGSQDVGIDAGNGTWYLHTGTGVQGSYNGWSNAPFGNNGNTYWYVEYYPVATITSLSTGSIAVGSNFTIIGRSFSSGVDSLDVNGTAVSTFTVNSDTQITATVPAGASTGPVHAFTEAGSATSSTNLTVGGAAANFKSGGTWHTAVGVFYKSGGAWQPVKGIFYKSGGVWNPTK